MDNLGYLFLWVYDKIKLVMNMKKKIGIILLIILFLLTGCKNKDEELEDTTEDFELVKIDDSKDYIYLEDVGDYKFSDGTDCYIKLPVFNIDSDDANNVNIELRSYIRNLIQSFKYDDEVVTKGYKLDYEYYISDEVLSLNLFTLNYIANSDSIYGDETNRTYNISLKTGKYLDNDNLLELYDYDEEKLLKRVEDLIESEDLMYSLMSIKNVGYDLYVDDDGKLCILFYENMDDESIRKELVLSD